MEYASEEYNKADFLMDIGRRENFYQPLPLHLQPPFDVERGMPNGFHEYFVGEF